MQVRACRSMGAGWGTEVRDKLLGIQAAEA